MADFWRSVLRLFGWTVVGVTPEEKKWVLIGAPHTSNWDFPVGLAAMWALGIEPRWVAKHTVFRWPLGVLMKALGGIPLDRERTQDFVQQSVREFEDRDELVLVLAPEGTRSRVEYWRTGFYYIALGAGAPIVLGFVDFARKRIGLGPTLRPSGDIEADFKTIRSFYADKTGKRPELEGEVRCRTDRVAS